MNKNFVDKFNEIKNGKEEFVFRKAFPNVISFEEFLNFREKSKQARDTRWEYDYKLSISFDIDGSPILSDNKAFSYFRSNLYEVWGEELWDEPAILITEILGHGSGLEPHTDPCEQIHWNCVGEALWTVTRFDGTEIYYSLKPGDVIFLPDGMKHGVKSLTIPRAGIAFSIDKKNYRKELKRGKYADL
jgi:mannose-6-phosphate isomerase-like protein (cupin superfamily)